MHHKIQFLDERQQLLMRLYDVLSVHFGPTGWWPADTPFEVCIGAILTQNAPWTGVRQSIARLKKDTALTPEGLLALPERDLANTIRPSIYYNQKAKRLRNFARYIRDECCGDINSLRNLQFDDARSRLLDLPGVGLETADSICAYALGMPVFVVDAYTRRIMSRHGLVDSGCGYEELRRFFEDALAPDAAFFAEFHALLCIAGAEFCRRMPKCAECPISNVLGEPVTCA